MKVNSVKEAILVFTRQGFDVVQCKYHLMTDDPENHLYFMDDDDIISAANDAVETNNDV